MGTGTAGLELWWLSLPDSEHGQEKWARVQGLLLVPFSTQGSPRSAALRNSKKEWGVLLRRLPHPKSTHWVGEKHPPPSSKEETSLVSLPGEEKLSLTDKGLKSPVTL